MDKTTHEVRRSRWKNIIEQCQNRPEGMSAKTWMKDSSISEKSYYYWLRQTFRSHERSSVDGKWILTAIMPHESEVHKQRTE